MNKIHKFDPECPFCNEELEFEDVELPPEDPSEWKECPSCTRLKKEIIELKKDAEYTIQVLKERQALRLALDKIKHKTTVYQSDGHICDAKVDNDAIHQIAKAALGEK